jgi:hypothetical protein
LLHSNKLPVGADTGLMHRSKEGGRNPSAITSLAGYGRNRASLSQCWFKRVQDWIVDGPTEKRESHDWTAGLTG